VSPSSLQVRTWPKAQFTGDHHLFKMMDFLKYVEQFYIKVKTPRSTWY